MWEELTEPSSKGEGDGKLTRTHSKRWRACGIPRTQLKRWRCGFPGTRIRMKPVSRGRGRRERTRSHLARAETCDPPPNPCRKKEDKLTPQKKIPKGEGGADVPQTRPERQGRYGPARTRRARRRMRRRPPNPARVGGKQVSNLTQALKLFPSRMAGMENSYKFRTTLRVQNL